MHRPNFTDRHRRCASSVQVRDRHVPLTDHHVVQLGRYGARTRKQERYQVGPAGAAGTTAMNRDQGQYSGSFEGVIVVEKSRRLVLNVEHLTDVQERYADAAHSDSTGTSTGDDGENADKLNHPE